MAVTGDEGVHSDNIFRYILNITSTLFRLDQKFKLTNRNKIEREWLSK